MSNSLDFRTQMNLVLAELIKKANNKITYMCGWVSLRGGALNALMDAYNRTGERAREIFNERKIKFGKRMFSWADVFEGKAGYSRNYVDRKCGLSGFRTKYWDTWGGRHHQHTLKTYWNFLQEGRDYNPENRTMAQQDICRAKSWIMYNWLITNYWGRGLGQVPPKLTTVNNAIKWCEFHYNKDYLDKVWKDSLMFKDEEFMAWFTNTHRAWGDQTYTQYCQNLQDGWDFACSFGEGKKYDLTQIMGTKEHTRAEVLALWQEQGNWDGFDLRDRD